MSDPISSTPVWVLGEALIDCIAEPNGYLKPLLGGSPFNLACATSLQGAQVGYLSPFSTDQFGIALDQRLRQCGATALQTPSDLPTSLAVIQLKNGQPTYGFYREGIADRDYSVATIAGLFEKCAPGILHTGSLMALPPEHHKTIEVVAIAKKRGWIISIDVNLRPKVSRDLVAYLQAVRELARYADWIKASDEDLQLLNETNDTLPRLSDAADIAANWRRAGCQRIALTFGDQGAYLQVGDVAHLAAAPKVNVVDTVGAGDTFWGACLADWAQYALSQNPQVAAEKRCSQTLRRALVAAAINCSRAGCQPPSKTEVDHALTLG